MVAIEEESFAQAVQLAAGFVANGDIRLGGDTQPSSDSALMLCDLIPTLYAVVEHARSTIEKGG